MSVLRRDDDEIRWSSIFVRQYRVTTCVFNLWCKGRAVTAACGVGRLPPYVNTHACYSICEMRARVTAPGYGGRILW